MKPLLKIFFVISLFSFCSTISIAQSLSVESQNNTSCATPNGTVSASVDGETLEYSFKWYEGADETGPLLSVQPTAANLRGGVYTVTATHNATAAVSGPLSVNVLDDIVVPVVSVVVVSPQTSCVVNNGSLTAVVNGQGADYTYAWYQGTDLSGPVLSMNQTIGQLTSLTYTVVVTHITSGCQSMVGAAVPGERIVPVATVELVSAYTNCAAPNGSLRAVPDGPAADYTYRWYKGSLHLGSGDQTIKELEDGLYNVVVTHRLSQCQSAWTSARVPNESLFPMVSINVLSELTSCTTPNGSLQAVPGGPATEYTYAWFRGPRPEGPVLSTNQTLSQLSNDGYTVQVTNKYTPMCKAMAVVTIQDRRPVFSASVQVLSHATSCTSSNGSLKAVPSTGTASSYTYRWYAGLTSQGSSISTSQSLLNRPAGSYTVVIKHKVSLCQTIVSGTIQDKTLTGTTVQVFQPLTSCSYPPGALKVTTPGPMTDYTYAWYEGATAEGEIASMTDIFWLMTPGVNTVVVTHKTTHCQVVLSGTLPDERPLPQVSVNVTSHETTCVSPNGSLTAVVGQGQPEDYTYSWYTGATAQGQVLSTDVTLSQLSAGTYTVAVVNNATQCQSEITAVVLDQKPVVEASVNIVSHQISCGSPALPTGFLQAVVNGPHSDYTFAWHEGTMLSSPVIFIGPVAAPLQAGIYTVVVTHNTSGCQAVISTIVQDVITPVVANVEVLSNNTSCTEPNGSLKAVVWGDNSADYTYEWYEGPTVFAGPVLSVSDELHMVAAGIYTVLITRLNSNCMTIASQNVLDECQNLMSRSGETDTQFTYYPNPTTGTLWIKGEAAPGYIVLSDQNGNVIYGQNLLPSDEPLSVDLAGQPAGIYVLTITSGLGTSSYHIVKQ
jgi:hypothetical protein